MQSSSNSSELYFLNILNHILNQNTIIMKKNEIKLNGKKLTRKQKKAIFILFLAKLGYQAMTPTEKVSKARQIVIAMTGNPNFTTPMPTLASITSAADDLDAAQIALDGTKIKTAERNTAEDLLDTLMSGLQGYVGSICLNDVEKTLSSGFDIRKANTKAEILPAPIGLTAVSTQIEGQVKLKWICAPGSKLLYMVQCTPDVSPMPTPTWDLVAQSSKAVVIIENLTPGTKYMFRVAVINSAGISGWSEIAVCRPN